MQKEGGAEKCGLNMVLFGYLRESTSFLAKGDDDHLWGE